MDKVTAVGVRAPCDSFFINGNKLLPQVKTFGILENDNEIFFHSVIRSFSCNVYGCKKSFDTIFEFEQHYNTFHRYFCDFCKKLLPTPHLLDLHISETHDSFFAVSAEKKPMFVCFSEECPEVFLNAKLRREHCVKNHCFPPSFWSDVKKKPDIPKEKSKCSNHQSVVAGEKKIKPGKPSVERMDIEKNETKTKKAIRGFLGSAVGRSKENPVFTNFARDMVDSLPNITNSNTVQQT